MELIRLELNNFKGIKHFILQPNGKSISVFGDNATGKTTLYDAFLWLLFGKDSQGKSDFAIKTLDSNNNEIHNLEHEVEGVFDIKGDELALKKVYAEKWTKKRGSATQEFSGHTTDYFINGVPVKKGEYGDKIAEIADENVFKLLTSPSYFNEQLHWQDRRKILLEIAGDVSDADVIKSSEALAKLPDILGDRKLDDHKKVVVSKKSEINKQLEKIPVRIDEVYKGMPDLTGLDLTNIKTDIAWIESNIKAKESELLTVKQGGQIAELKKQIAEIDATLMQIKNEAAGGLNKVYDDLVKNLRTKEVKLKELTDLYRDEIDEEIKSREKAEKSEKEIDEYRQNWIKVNDQTFSPSKNCPTCGQEIPSSQIEESIANFNANKAKELELISAKAKNKKTEIEALRVKESEAKAKSEEIYKKCTEINVLILEIKKRIEIISNNKEDMSSRYQYQAKLSEKQALELEMEGLKGGIESAVEIIEQEIKDLQADLGILKISEQKFITAEQSKARIKELEAEQRELAKEFEQLEQELYLMEQFIVAKVNILEGKINSKFSMAKFKLFETQVNGGINEVCETLYNGVPYSSGLNNAARINVGLDIINTLAKHYKFTPPIFIDNREAVTKLIDTKAQVVSLIVSEIDKKLRVEE